MVQVSDIWQIQHVGFSVSSIDRSLSIYRDILGMEVALDVEVTGDHLKEHFHDALGLKHKKLRVANVKSATGVWLELFEFSDPPPKPIPPEARFSDIGINQICLEVKDIEEAIAWIVNAVGYAYYKEKQSENLPINLARRPAVNLSMTDYQRELIIASRRTPDEIRRF